MIEVPGSPPLDPRHTFLARHIERELNRTDEVLALRRLVEVARDAAPERRASINLRGFFYGFDPDGVHEGDELPDREPQLYRPVPVIGPGDHAGRWAGGLTELLVALDDQAATHGVLLASGSGAGKTVAGIKALADCFWAGPKQTPLLAGRVPVRIQPTKASKASEHAGSGERIDAYLAETAGVSIAVARRCRLAGPPLLIFCDLNATPLAQRAPLVDALVQHQLAQADLPAEARGRCVVTYRSAQRGDAVIDTLTGGGEPDGAFAEYDLATIDLAFAQDYLSNVRFVERVLLDRWEGDLDTERIEADRAKLAELAAEASAGGRDSIISTPLLMHFCSLLSSDELAGVRHFADLYDRVVDRLLHHNWRYASLHDAAERPLFLRDEADAIAFTRACMTRVALRTLSIGPNEVRLPRSQCLDLVRYPEDHEETLSPPEPTIGPADDSPYDDVERSLVRRNLPSIVGARADGRAVQLGASDASALIEMSLLRSDAQAGAADDADMPLGFLHDSLLYYFASEAMWRPFGPHRSTAADLRSRHEDGWADHAAAWMADAPQVWQLGARFLAARLPRPTRQGLVARVVPAKAQQGLSAMLLELCSRGDSGGPVASVRDAIHRYGDWTHAKPPTVIGVVLDALALTDSESLELAVDIESRWRGRVDADESIRCEWGSVLPGEHQIAVVDNAYGFAACRMGGSPAREARGWFVCGTWRAVSPPARPCRATRVG